MTYGIIAAVSPEGVIGVGNDLPWHYPADLKRFKRLTLGNTIIMGRSTWESLPKKPLPGRRNIVITSRELAGVECFAAIEAALATCTGDVWFIGGARIFAAAMEIADVIDLTYVPDRIDAPNAVRFPKLDNAVWQGEPVHQHEDDERLQRQIFRRRLVAAGGRE